MELAKHHLGRALAMQPEADHVLYTLALCWPSRVMETAQENPGSGNLHLEPRNRILARQDPEFSALAAQFPGLRALLVSEPSGSY